MPIFKNHHGQFHKMNTALVALTSLYVIGAAVALSSPYWASSCPVLAPLATFAATPIGMGILAFVAVALIGLAVYAISKNNEISELEAPKLSVSSDNAYLVLQVSSKDSKFINENYKVGDKCLIDCANSKGEVYRITVDGHVKYSEHKEPILLGSTHLLNVSSLEVKNDDGRYTPINDRNKQLETLGLGDQYAKELSITFMPSSVVKGASAQPAASQGPGKQ